MAELYQKRQKFEKTTEFQKLVARPNMITFSGSKLILNRLLGIYSQGDFQPNRTTLPLADFSKNWNFTMSKNQFLRIFSPTGWRIFKKIFLPERPSQDAQKSGSHLCRCDTPFGRYSQISFVPCGISLLPHWKSNFLLMARVVFIKTHYVRFFLKNHLV